MPRLTRSCQQARQHPESLRREAQEHEGRAARRRRRPAGTARSRCGSSRRRDRNDAGASAPRISTPMMAAEMTAVADPAAEESERAVAVGSSSSSACASGRDQRERRRSPRAPPARSRGRRCAAAIWLRIARMSARALSRSRIKRSHFALQSIRDCKAIASPFPRSRQSTFPAGFGCATGAPMTTRVSRRFAELRKAARPALVTFVTAGDPDYDTSLADPEGAAGGRRRHRRARHAVLRSDGRRPGDPGGGAARAEGRPDHGEDARTWCAPSAPATSDTPLVLMGYYNPIYIYGNERFLADAKAAGVDGLIIVDLPPEADDELCLPAMQGRAELHPPRHADHRRQAAAGGAQEHLRLRLLRLDHRHHRHQDAGQPRASRRRLTASSGIPIYRLWSVSA